MGSTRHSASARSTTCCGTIRAPTPWVLRVRGAEESGAEKPETGQHITIVDTITSAATIATKRDPKKKIFRITVGSGRGAVTATFFNARFISKDLIKGTRVMLSGEVGFYRNTMQLTHPAFLILDGRSRGSNSLKNIAKASEITRGASWR